MLFDWSHQYEVQGDRISSRKWTDEQLARRIAKSLGAAKSTMWYLCTHKNTLLRSTISNGQIDHGTQLKGNSTELFPWRRQTLSQNEIT